MCERLRSHFKGRLESLHLKENEGLYLSRVLGLEKRNRDLLSLQESIMDIENTLNSLSNELAEMRVMVAESMQNEA